MWKPGLIAAIACTFFTIGPAWAQSGAASDGQRLERLEHAVQLLQQRNDELEREVSRLKEHKSSTSVAAAAKPETPSAPTASSEKNVVEVKPPKEEKKSVLVNAAGSELKLTLGGFIQAQYEVGDIAAFEGRFVAGANKDRFRLRRSRINLSGDFAEQFDFKIEGDFAQTDSGITVRDATGRLLASTSTRTSFSGTDIFINWHQFPEFNIKVGQYKAPFGLEQLTSDTKLFLIERSQVTSALTPERQVGVMVWGKPLASVLPEQKDLLTYSAGIFNGNGRNNVVNDNNEYMYAGRVDLQAFKGKMFNQDASVKFGADALSSRDDAGTVLTPVGNLRVNSDGSLTSFSAPSAAERDAYGFDGSLHLGPFDLVGEYLSERFHSRRVNGVAPRFTGFRADGYYAQGSYFVIPKKLQLVTKWESFNPGQFSNDDIHSVSAGVNYYLKGDDVKLLADYIHTWSDFRERNPRFGPNQFDEVIVRLQLAF